MAASDGSLTEADLPACKSIQGEVPYFRAGETYDTTVVTDVRTLSPSFSTAMAMENVAERLEKEGD